MKAKLASTKAVIDALGGPVKVGKMLGRSPQQAVNWKKDGVFPSWTFVMMQKALDAEGFCAPPRLWRKMENAAG